MLNIFKILSLVVSKIMPYRNYLYIFLQIQQKNDVPCTTSAMLFSFVSWPYKMMYSIDF